MSKYSRLLRLLDYGLIPLLWYPLSSGILFVLLNPALRWTVYGRNDL